MTPLEAIEACPYLASPGHLAIADTAGKWQSPPHLRKINAELVEMAYGNNERLIINVPFQHGKSWLCSHYFPAWLLLLFPQTRILLAAHEERYAATFGMKVKEVLERWGGDLGVRLKKDSRAKNEWVIRTHGGGMVCKGLKGSLQGRPADLFIIDDPIKDAEQALSPTIMQSHWDWYSTVAYSRLGPSAPILIVTTRWVKNDLCGKIIEESKDTSEKWKVIKFPAIAEKNDVLGRKEGEPLWQNRVPLRKLLLIKKKRGRWFSACWQQSPEDEQGTWFRPKNADGSWAWPLYAYLGDAYALKRDGAARKVVHASEVTRITSIDWAWSEKKTADFSALATFGMCYEGEIMPLDVVNERIHVTKLALALRDVCRRLRPHMVVCEVGHPTLSNEYRKYPEIPEVRWIKTDNRSKLTRALAAMQYTDNGMFFLPEGNPPWLEEYAKQMASFTGLDDDHDDMVDATSYACQVAQQLRQVKPQPHDLDLLPDVLTAGREMM